MCECRIELDSGPNSFALLIDGDTWIGTRIKYCSLHANAATNQIVLDDARHKIEILQDIVTDTRKLLLMWPMDGEDANIPPYIIKNLAKKVEALDGY